MVSENLKKIASLFIASLKAMTLTHLHSHWTTQGSNFFGSHLLFERIYQSAQENLDGAAEKFVAVCGSEVLDWSTQNDLLHKILGKLEKVSEDPLTLSLEIEKQFLNLCQQTEAAFDEEGELSQGIANLLQNIADDRENAVYLLQQTMKTKDKTNE